MSDYRQPSASTDEMVGRVARAIGFGWDGSDIDHIDYLSVADQIVELLDPDFAVAREDGRRERDAEVAGLRAALEACVLVLAPMDTLRHLEPDFPALDLARAALAAAPGLDVELGK